VPIGDGDSKYCARVAQALMPAVSKLLSTLARREGGAGKSADAAGKSACATSEVVAPNYRRGAASSCFIACEFAAAFCCIGPAIAADWSLYFWPSWILVLSPVNFPI
jgi:hypothetical protein